MNIFHKNYIYMTKFTVKYFFYNLFKIKVTPRVSKKGGGWFRPLLEKKAEVTFTRGSDTASTLAFLLVF